MTVEQIAALLTSASILAGGIFFVVKEIKKERRRYRKAFHNNWTNEGDVTGWRTYTHYVYLNLEVDEEDGEVTGILETRQLKTKDKIELKNISVNGKVDFKKAIITLSDFRRGQSLDCGKVELKLKGKNIYWTLVKGNSDFLPQKAQLWYN